MEIKNNLSEKMLYKHKNMDDDKFRAVIEH